MKIAQQPCAQASSRAFSLVELLIAVVLSAILLAGMAFVLEASLTNYDINERVGDVHKVGRLLTEHIARDIRQAEDVTNDENTNTLTIFPADPDRAQSIRYQLDGNGNFTYRIATNTGTQTYTIFQANENPHVSAFALGDIDEKNVDGTYKAVYVPVSVTFTHNGETYTFQTSGSPRANQ